MADTNNNTKILQWNVCGLRNKMHHIRAVAGTEGIDIFMLQETKLKNNDLSLTGYQTFISSHPDGLGGLVTFVRNNIHAAKIEDPPDCGESCEVLGVRINLRNNEVALYNVYRNPQADFTAGELLSTAHNEKVIIAGDFNAHHTRLNPNLGKVNATGRQLMCCLDQIPEVTLMTEPEATHVLGGTLDLTFVSTDIYPSVEWSLHPTLTSDHFAISIIFDDPTPEHIPLPPPKWNLKKINWRMFQRELDAWSENYTPPDDINEAEKDLVRAFHVALDKACPVARHGNRQYKDHWYYNDEVKELYARVNASRKLFRRHRNTDNRNCYKRRFVPPTGD